MTVGERLRALVEGYVLRCFYRGASVIDTYEVRNGMFCIWSVGIEQNGGVSVCSSDDKLFIEDEGDRFSILREVCEEAKSTGVNVVGSFALEKIEALEEWVRGMDYCLNGCVKVASKIHHRVCDQNNAILVLESRMDQQRVLIDSILKLINKD